MAIILSQLAKKLYPAYTVRSYGLVVQGNKRFKRNYRRVLKNGRGLTFFEATYACLPTEYLPLFEVGCQIKKIVPYTASQSV